MFSLLKLPNIGDDRTQVQNIRWKIAQDILTELNTVQYGCNSEDETLMSGVALDVGSRGTRFYLGSWLE